MRKILATIAVASVSGCTTFSPYIPPTYTANQSVLDRATTLHNDLRARADDIRTSHHWLIGLGIASAIASAGFVGFEAHPDNVKAAGLTALATTTFNTSVTPVSKVQRLVSAAASARCVAEEYQAIDAPRSPYAVELNGARLSYEAALSNLVFLLSASASYDKRSAELGTAMTRGEAARSNLQDAVKSLDEYESSARDALTDIEEFVSKTEIPDLGKVIKDLSDARYSPPSPPVEGDPQAKEELRNTGVLQSFARDEDAEQSALAASINTLVNAIDASRPGRASTGLGRLKACTAKLVSS